MEAVDSMEMALGVNPRPGRVPEQDLLTPETCLRWRRSYGTFRGLMIPVFRVFPNRRIYGRRGEVGGGQGGPHYP